MDIIKKIEELYPKFTKKQRQIADCILMNVESMSFKTLKELSKEAGTTEITVLNFYKALGLDNFNEAKYEFRKYINQNMRKEMYEQNDYYTTNIPEYELTDKEKVIREICIEEEQLVSTTLRNVGYTKVLQLAKRFIEAKKIALCGRGISFLLAQYCYNALAAVEINSSLVNAELNDHIYSGLAMMDEEALVVVFSFPDYYYVTTKLAEYAKKKKCYVVAITDKKDSEVIPYADEYLLCQSNTRMFLNTLSAPMAVMNLLTSAIKLEMDSKEGKTTCCGMEFAELF